MAKNKKKVKKITEEQYIAYVTTLKNDPAVYCADGKQVLPAEYVKEEKGKKKGD